MTDMDVTDVACPTCKAPVGTACTIRGRKVAHLTRADKHVRKYNREVVRRIDALNTPVGTRDEHRGPGLDYVRKHFDRKVAIDNRQQDQLNQGVTP